MPLFQITRLARCHEKVLGYVPASDGVAALAALGPTGCTDDDWLEAEEVAGFAATADITRTAQ